MKKGFEIWYEESATTRVDMSEGLTVRGDLITSVLDKGVNERGYHPPSVSIQ